MSLCAKCALHERTCCQSVDVLVTEGDIGRIVAATGRADFWEFRRPDDPYHLQAEPSDPLWLAYTVRPDGTRAELKQQANGDCVFLSRSGCVLAREERPLTCRLYPYDYDEGALSGHHTACPTYLLEPGEELLAAIGMRREEAEAWRRQIYEELRSGSVYHQNRAAPEPVARRSAASGSAAPGPRTDLSGS